MCIETNSSQLITSKYEKELCTRLHCTTYGPNHYSPCQHRAGVCCSVVVAMTKGLTRNNFIWKRFASLVVWGSCSAWESIATVPDPSHGGRCLLTQLSRSESRDGKNANVLLILSFSLSSFNSAQHLSLRDAAKHFSG